MSLLCRARHFAEPTRGTEELLGRVGDRPSTIADAASRAEAKARGVPIPQMCLAPPRTSKFEVRTRADAVSMNSSAANPQHDASSDRLKPPGVTKKILKNLQGSGCALLTREAINGLN